MGKFGNVGTLVRRFSSARSRTAPRGPKLGAASINLMLRGSTIHRTACSFLSIRALKSPSRARRRCRVAAAVNPQMSECRTRRPGAEGSDFYLRWSPAGSRRRCGGGISLSAQRSVGPVRRPCVARVACIAPFAFRPRRSDVSALRGECVSGVSMPDYVAPKPRSYVFMTRYTYVKILYVLFCLIVCTFIFLVLLLYVKLTAR